MPTNSNDNAAPARTPAEHRAAVAAVEPSRFRGGLPRLVARVVKGDPEAGWSILKYMRTTAPAANDNLALSTGQGDADSATGVLTETDRRLRIRPTVNEMMAEAFRARVVLERRRDGRPGKSWRHGGLHDVRIEGDEIHLGDMVFSTACDAIRPEAGGLMTRFGHTAKGRPRIPEIDTTAERGSNQAPRSAAAVRAYLALPGVASPPKADASPRVWAPSITTSYNPLARSKKHDRFGVEEGRQFMSKLKVDGTVSFDEARRNAGLAPAKRGPVAIAAGAAFLGGSVHPSGKCGGPAPIDDNRESISDRAVMVLEEALANGTLSDVGLKLGFAASFAARAAGKAFASAVAEVQVAFPAPRRANNDNPQPRRVAS